MGLGFSSREFFGGGGDSGCWGLICAVEGCLASAAKGAPPHATTQTHSFTPTCFSPLPVGQPHIPARVSACCGAETSRGAWDGLPAVLNPSSLLSPLPPQILHILSGKIVIGHAIHNDFKALKYFHPKALTRDTSKIPLLNRKGGFPENVSISLKRLAKELLHQDIQVPRPDPPPGSRRPPRGAAAKLLPPPGAPRLPPTSTKSWGAAWGTTPG